MDDVDGLILIRDKEFNSVYSRIQDIVLDLKNLQQGIHNKSNETRSEWKGDCANAYARVEKENHAIFGTIIEELSTINEFMLETSKAFASEDIALSEQIGRD